MHRRFSRWCHAGVWERVFEVLTDDHDNRLNITTGTSVSGLVAALRMAREKYGDKITVNGSAEFREQIARAAAKHGDSTSSKLSRSTKMTEDDEIEAALAALDSPAQPQKDAKTTSKDPQPEPEEAPQDSSPASPTLGALEQRRRPKDKTVCEDCPNSVWFTSPDEVKCYCRVMYLIVWSNKEPKQITGCDGLYLGQD